jgi:hypothetical protein
VELVTGGRHVAGVQADLVWDDACATLLACQAAPGLAKSVFSRARPASYRAFVLSLGDVEPIFDGRLYCCSFEVEPGGSGCCSIALTAALASDPAGRAIAIGDVEDRICRD